MSLPDIPRCEENARLRAQLEDMKLALQKAHEILGYATDSPDTLRRRRNSMVRWNEVYATALARLETHIREHKCGADAASSTP